MQPCKSKSIGGKEPIEERKKKLSGLDKNYNLMYMCKRDGRSVTTLFTDTVDLICKSTEPTDEM